MSGDDLEEDGHAGIGLPRDVQEHLGKRLRSALHVEADKPAYLGEPSVPPQFESYLRRLEAGERGERQGYEAVKRALDETSSSGGGGQNSG